MSVTTTGPVRHYTPESLQIAGGFGVDAWNQTNVIPVTYQAYPSLTYPATQTTPYSGTVPYASGGYIAAPAYVTIPGLTLITNITTHTNPHPQGNSTMAYYDLELYQFSPDGETVTRVYQQSLASALAESRLGEAVRRKISKIFNDNAHLQKYRLELEGTCYWRVALSPYYARNRPNPYVRFFTVTGNLSTEREPVLSDFSYWRLTHMSVNAKTKAVTQDKRGTKQILMQCRNLVQLDTCKRPMCKARSVYHFWQLENDAGDRHLVFADCGCYISPEQIKYALSNDAIKDMFSLHVCDKDIVPMRFAASAADFGTLTPEKRFALELAQTKRLLAHDKNAWPHCKCPTCIQIHRELYNHA